MYHHEATSGLHKVRVTSELPEWSLLKKRLLRLLGRLQRINNLNLQFRARMVEYAISVAMLTIHIHPMGKMELLVV